MEGSIVAQATRGAGEVAKSSTSGFAGSRKRTLIDLAWVFKTTKPNPDDILPLRRPHLLQQDHTS